MAGYGPKSELTDVARFRRRLVVVALSTESVANIPLCLAFRAREGMCHRWQLVVVVVVVAVALSMELVADVPLRLAFRAREGMYHCWSRCWQLSATFDVTRRAKTLLATSLYLQTLCNDLVQQLGWHNICKIPYKGVSQ